MTQCELTGTSFGVTRNTKPQETSVIGELGVVALMLPLLRKSGERRRKTETNRYARFCPILLDVSARLAALVASLDCLVCLAVNVDFAPLLAKIQWRLGLLDARLCCACQTGIC